MVEGSEVKRRAFALMVYGVLEGEEVTTLKATQETKAHEIIAQVGSFVFQKCWNKKGFLK